MQREVLEVHQLLVPDLGGVLTSQDLGAFQLWSAGTLPVTPTPSLPHLTFVYVILYRVAADAILLEARIFPLLICKPSIQEGRRPQADQSAKDALGQVLLKKEREDLGVTLRSRIHPEFQNSTAILEQIQDR